MKGEWRRERGRGEWLAARPVPFTPGGRAPSTHWVRDYIGLVAVADAVTETKRSAPVGKRIHS
jgi:hypothetical protein